MGGLISYFACCKTWLRAESMATIRASRRRDWSDGPFFVPYRLHTCSRGSCLKILKLTIALIVLSGASACATFEVEGSGSISPNARTGSETVHGSLYGFRWRPFTVEKCGTDSLFRVEGHTNVGLILVSVATLGLYVPQTVEWWCYTPDGDDLDEEVWDPDADLRGITE